MQKLLIIINRVKLSIIVPLSDMFASLINIRLYMIITKQLALILSNDSFSTF